ncbi:complement factor H isoform X2 [Chanos chanos]|uniref:Complement factor H isoform X2 n=1 Tax=Chanos chanos TaxID=29144 RepID=A0A6J2W813_CHACN|nr:complement factor H-like isoform X2 [Chanos chanos]
MTVYTSRLIVLALCVCSFTVVKGQGCAKQDITKNYANFDTSALEDNYEVGQSVRVTCHDGYVGVYRFNCKATGWDGRGRPCQPKPCGHPGDTPNGDFELTQGEDFVLGAMVKYKCRQGYVMQSLLDYRACLSQGWSNAVPICEVVRCPPVNTEDNVIASGNTEEGRYQDVIHFECKSARDMLDGPQEIHCTEDGKWNDRFPICIEIKCLPVEIQNGRIVNEKPEYKEDEQLRFECNKGFQAKPGRKPQCTRHGWSITPECEEIVCRVESRPTNAVIKPEGQTVFRPGQRVEITCSEGYWLFWTKDTSHKVLCKSDGQWERSLICEEITCEYPRDDHLYDYWSRFPRTGRLGRTSDYSCQSGYYKAAEKAKCTENGWQPKPLCLASVCEEPDLPHANIIRKSVSRQTHYTHGEWIEYECETGYEPKGRITIHCLQRDAGSAPQWSGIRQCRGSAVVKRCDALDVENGFAVEKRESSSSATAHYACDPGHKPFTGPWWGELTCTDGKWSETPLCIRNEQCGALPNVPHLQKNAPEAVDQGDTRRIECEPGYKPVPVSAQCQNGHWSNVTCEPEACGPPPRVDNAVIDSDYQDHYRENVCLTYKCRAEFKMEGESRVCCQSGQWLDIPKCISQFCSEPDKERNNSRLLPSNKEKYRNGEKVQYECNDGYVLLNTGEATCENGQWTYPQCVWNGCEVQTELWPHVDVADVHFQEDKIKHGGTMRYTCKEPYNWEFGTLTCRDGQWGAPKCTSRTCPYPPFVENAKMTVEKSDTEGLITEVSYTCTEPYELSSAATIACKGGKWESPPNCQSDKVCPKPVPEEDNASVSTNFIKRIYMEGDVLQYTCETGYESERPISYSCRGGEWVKSGRGKCSPSRRDQCGPPPTVDSAEVISTVKHQYEEGNRVEYQCQAKYTISQNRHMTCHRGQWTGEVKCLKPCTVTNAEMDKNHIEFKYGEKNKLYAPHLDYITFECKRWKRPRPQSPDFRQQCFDGSMTLPRCV